jgi:protein TonB
MPVSFALHAAGIAGLLAVSLVVPVEPPTPAPPRITDVGWLPRVGPRVSPPARDPAVSRPPRVVRRAATHVFEVPVDAQAIEPEAFAPDDAVDCVGCALRGGVPGGDPDGERSGDGDAEGPGTAPMGNDPVRVGGHIQAPRKIHHVDPAYPELARTARVSGIVILECVIDREGRVQSVQVLSGHPLLQAAAMHAVGQWAYTPTRLNGVPVSVVMTVTVRFISR